MKGCRQLVAALGLVALGAPAAQAVEGRILGSLQRVEGRTDDDAFRILYDVGGRQTISQSTNLRLRMSLNYFSRLQGGGSDLWTSRFFGEFRAPSWLVDAQFAPWRDQAPGGSLGRQRDGNLGVRFMPRNLPQLDARYERRERDVDGQRSATEDRRIRMSYARGATNGSVGYRRVDTQPAPGIAVESATEEWRGQLTSSKSWRQVNVGGTYEALLSTYDSRDRRRELGTQRVLANVIYNPARRVTIGADVLRRWGYAADNSPQGGGDIDEESYGANVLYQPTLDLTLQLSRAYRREQARNGRILSDYVQGDARFRRLMAREMWFQAGYLGILDLASERGSVPSNTAYVLVDGRLSRGVEGRAEVRAAKPEGPEVSGIQWHREVRLRTRPVQVLRFEVDWRKDTQAEIFGVAQEDREWELLGAFEPASGSNLAISWRRLDGSGRLLRSEELWVLNGTYRVSDRSQLSLNWSRRNALQPTVVTLSDAFVADFTFWLPSDWQARASYREDLLLASSQRSYGLILERRF